MPTPPSPASRRTPSPPGFSGKPSRSLWVGELGPETTEADLIAVFHPIGPLSGVRLCRDAKTQRSLGYAYVNYECSKDASRASKALTFKNINGKPCRIMSQLRNARSLRIDSPNTNNVVIKNLPRDKMSARGIYEWILELAGREIESCKIGTDRKTGAPLGYAFAQFKSDSDAENAIERINTSKMSAGNGRVVSAERFDSGKTLSTIYVRGLPSNWNREEISTFFEKFGPVESVRLPTASSGTCFVRFQQAHSAEKAILDIHETTLEGREIIVERALSGKERRRRQLESKNNSPERTSTVRSPSSPKGLKPNSDGAAAQSEELPPGDKRNLFVTGLEAWVGVEALSNLFRAYGQIVGCHVAYMRNGRPRGFGFVTFKEEQDAVKALETLDGHLLGDTRLSVAVSEGRRRRASPPSRRRRSSSHHQRPRGVAASPGLSGGKPSYVSNYNSHSYSHNHTRSVPVDLYQQKGRHRGKSVGGQPQYWSQAYPLILPSQHKPSPFHSPPKVSLVPTMGTPQSHRHRSSSPRRSRPASQLNGGTTLSYLKGNRNHYRPGQTPVATGHREGVPPIVPTLVPTRAPTRSGWGGASQKGTSSPTKRAARMWEREVPVARQTEREELGNQLYPLIQKIDAKNAPKLTGMLLELTTKELRIMIRSPNNLLNAVSEAQKLLKVAGFVLESPTSNATGGRLVSCGRAQY